MMALRVVVLLTLATFLGHAKMLRSRSALKEEGFGPLVALMKARTGAAPAGTYEGSKRILGFEIKGTILIESPTTLDFAIFGPATLECDGEAFHLDGSDIVFEHIENPGDCLHDTLDENHVDLSSITYDDNSDAIAVTVVYDDISITLDLQHQDDTISVGR